MPHKLLCLLSLAVSLIAHSETLITFDDYTNKPIDAITEPYHGFNFANTVALNVTLPPYNEPAFTAKNALVTGGYVAFDGGAAVITSATSELFTFNSGYFSSAYAPQSIANFSAWRGKDLVFNQTFYISSSGPIFVELNIADIDTLYIKSEVGMDNLLFNAPVPEVGASELMLIGLAFIVMIGFFRKISPSSLQTSKSHD